jgi:hypothetical protein
VPKILADTKQISTDQLAEAIQDYAEKHLPGGAENPFDMLTIKTTPHHFLMHNINTGTSRSLLFGPKPAPEDKATPYPTVVNFKSLTLPESRLKEIIDAYTQKTAPVVEAAAEIAPALEVEPLALAEEAPTLPRPHNGGYSPTGFKLWLNPVFDKKASNIIYDVSGKQFIADVSLPYAAIQAKLALMGFTPADCQMPETDPGPQKTQFTITFTEAQAKTAYARGLGRDPNAGHGPAH